MLYSRDIRNPAGPTHVSTSAHSDDITSVSFHPSTSHLLLSASTDGLLCTTDSREPDEDESSLQVGNWGCSIAKAGWTGSDAPAAWAHSDMQTFSTWTEEVSRSQSVMHIWPGFEGWTRCVAGQYRRPRRPSKACYQRSVGFRVLYRRDMGCRRRFIILSGSLLMDWSQQVGILPSDYPSHCASALSDAFLAGISHYCVWSIRGPGSSSEF